MTTQLYCALLALAATSVASANSSRTQTAEYAIRDEIRGGNVHLANFAVRPMVMVLDPGNTVPRPKRLWVVNTTEDLVETFQQRGGGFGSETTPGLSLHVPRDPVSLGHWVGGDQIIVVCRGTNGITRLSAEDGTIIDHITLVKGGLPGVGNEGHGGMAEPGDILIDEATNMAFVSCSGVDAVIQIDLLAGEIVRRFSYWNATNPDDKFLCKNPLFLCFAPGPAGPMGRKVLVAPLRSGNGSVLTDIPGEGLAEPGRIGVPDFSTAEARSIPDQDLFEITPFVDAASLGTVEPVLGMSGIGTILFSHGIHPSGEHWQLTTDLFNAEEDSPSNHDNSSEPLLEGEFAKNLLQRTAVLGGVGSNIAPNSLEQMGPGSFDGVGQPYALAFGDLTNAGFTAGVLTDNVVQINSAGAVTKEWDLDDGSIPRGLLTDVFGTVELLFVYCSGTNEVQLYRTNVSGTPAFIRTYHLTDESVTPEFKRGREIFFDGERSLTGTMSCATCHVDGASDGLAWNLSDAGRQEKGAMVTQTLVGIERVGGLHWRGERELSDFNGAFDGLLGGHHIPGMMAQLTPTELADFDHFIHALRNPANPYQNRFRKVDSSITFFPDYLLDDFESGGLAQFTGDAVIGQKEFNTIGLLEGSNFRCSDCHHAPTGTSGMSFPIFPVAMPNPARTNIKPASLHELWRKDQAIDPNFPSQPILGFGFSHGGVRRDLPTFLSFVGAVDPAATAGTPGALGSPAASFSNQIQMNTAEFTHQWDQGLSPASQYAYMLNDATIADGTAVPETFIYLELQSATQVSNCDLVVIGKTEVNGTLQDVRWWRDETTPGKLKYVSDMPGVGPRNYRSFYLGVLNGDEEHLFMGYPVGMGERMALDRDLDGITDRAELLAGTDPRDPASPGASGGATPTAFDESVLWTQPTMARVSFQTNVPTTVDSLRIVETDLMGTEIGPPRPVVLDEDFSRFHAPLVTGLRPATTLRDNAVSSVLAVDFPIYKVTVYYRARDGQTSSADFLDIVTLPFSQGTKPAAPIPELRLQTPLHTQHQIVESEVVSISPSTYKVGISLQYVRGGNRSLMPANRAVLGHVVITRANGDFEVMKKTQLTPGVANDVHIVAGVEGKTGSTTLPVDFEIREREGALMVPISDPGIVAVLELTDGAAAPGGTLDLEFSFDLESGVALPGLGDKVTFVFDGIFEIFPKGALSPQGNWDDAISDQVANDPDPLTIPLFSFNQSQWNFPTSGEDLTFPTAEF